MKSRLLASLCLGLTVSFLPLSSQEHPGGQSVYPLKPNDPKAVYLTREHFAVVGDGVADDAGALQAAIDQVLKQTRQGVVFVPEGTYRLGKTVRLWSGIRLLGFGARRPTFKLGDNTPGYQEGDHNYMVHFAHSPGGGDPNQVQPGTWSTADFIDGTWTTFFSGINNINFEIGRGNPAAIAVRYHIAQVCALENIDFNVGSGRGAVEEMGNIIENCSFRGGAWAIKTNSSAPDWQCLALDCRFEGQREASVITQNAKMLVIRGRFKDSPVGILVPDREKLYVKDTWFENISNAAIVINNFVPPDLQVNLDNIGIAKTPYSVRFNGRTQGWSKHEVKMDYEAPAPVYTVKSFSHGLHVDLPHGDKGKVEFATRIEQAPRESLGEFTPRDQPALPPQATWVNIGELGATGDGRTDCTEIFEKAIAQHNTIYVPLGKYVVSRTLTLRDQTTLIGFHPALTQLILLDGTPGFTDAGHTRPLVEAPKDGANGISGIGFNLGHNPGVIGIKWKAGIRSYINDSVFNGGRGGSLFGTGQAHTIWVTDGGAGIFKNFWINDVRSKMAFCVSDTKNPGKVYEISIEHHKDIEVRIDNVENWSFYALQMEEDRGCEQTLAVEIKDSRNILFANLICHRTTGVWQPYHTAIQIRNAHGISIQGNEMRGGVFPYDHALYDEVTGEIVSQRLFTKLTVK